MKKLFFIIIVSVLTGCGESSGGHANLMIEMGEHYIKCMMCYTTTGWKNNEESAIKSWNTRQ